MQNKITVLGSTGSIGTQTLDVCRRLGLPVATLAARGNIGLLEEQAREFLPEAVAVADESRYPALRAALADTPVRVVAGEQALCELAAADSAGTVVGAIVGLAGLRPVLAAARAGKTIALANKEPLVAAGGLLTETARRGGARLIPVDSEHSAIFQCLQAGRREDVAGVVLTASGGPFFGWTRERLAQVTPSMALRHPNWAMGAKITVDSATLMNKGLELIEAMWLFGLAPEQIEVVVHRQSVVHSAVSFADGSLIAQLGPPDMHAAIQYALTWPRRLPVPEAQRLSLIRLGRLDFAQPDREAFACLAHCEWAARRGGLVPCAASAANEAAVQLFLEERIGFLQIADLVRETAESLSLPGEATLEAVLETDALARAYVRRRARDRQTMN